jgi:type II secretory ATPase GspE/PulE/Tfp pilus assembly ATPase PilB-like protein
VFNLKSHEKRIAARLMSSGELKEADLQRALEEFDDQTPFHEFLVSRKMVSRKAATKALAEVNGFQFVELADLPVSPNALKLLTADQAWRLGALPVWREKEALTVAVSDPSNVLAVDEVKLKSRCPVMVVVAEPEDLISALEYYYGSPPSGVHIPIPEEMEVSINIPTPFEEPGQRSLHEQQTRIDTDNLEELAQQRVESLERHREYQRRMRDRSSGQVSTKIGQAETVFEVSSDAVLKDLESDRIREGAYEDPPSATAVEQEAPAGVKQLYQVLEDAAERRITEAVLSPTPEGVRIRYRQQGYWEERGSYETASHPEVIKHLRRISHLEEQPEENPLEHKFLLPTRHGEMLCHLFLSPTPEGVRALIRFTESLPLLGDPLLDIGLPRDVATRLNGRLMTSGGGVMFISSPDARTLNHLYSSIIRGLTDDGKRDVVSLERPPQRRLPGITSINCPSEQVLLASLANASFMNPDALGIASVENGTVLNRVINVGMRGTTVLACFTAPNSEVAQQCFTAAAVDPMNMLRGVAAHLHVQEAPRLCQHCQKEIEDRDSLPGWASALHAPFYEAAGCPICGETGYRGTVHLVELFQPDVEKADGTFTQICDRAAELLALSLAGEIDPREYRE